MPVAERTTLLDQYERMLTNTVQLETLLPHSDLFKAEGAGLTEAALLGRGIDQRLITRFAEQGAENINPFRGNNLTKILTPAQSLLGWSAWENPTTATMLDQLKADEQYAFVQDHPREAVDPDKQAMRAWVERHLGQDCLEQLQWTIFRLSAIAALRKNAGGKYVDARAELRDINRLLMNQASITVTGGQPFQVSEKVQERYANQSKLMLQLAKGVLRKNMRVNWQRMPLQLAEAQATYHLGRACLLMLQAMRSAGEEANVDLEEIKKLLQQAAVLNEATIDGLAEEEMSLLLGSRVYRKARLRLGSTVS